MQDFSEQTVCIIEKDTNGDVLLTWAYPSLEDDIEPVLIARSNLSQETIPLQFTYSKYKNNWVYIWTQPFDKENSSPSNPLNKVAVFSVCLLRSVFNPEKYAALSKLMASLYATSGDPIKILQCHLSVFTKGSFDAGNLGKFVDSEYDNRRAYLVTSVKDVVRVLGEETVLLWVALLCKKRVAVYSDRLPVLLKAIRGFPVLVWHRQNWSVLRPYVTMHPNEMADLVSAGVYCAGFTDPSIKNQENLYDLFVDINSRSTYVPNHAKDDFTMTSFHEDLANFLVTSADDSEVNDQTLIKNLTLKTKELLAKLESLKGDDQYVTMEALEARKINPSLARFLYAVACAEGLSKSG